MSDSETDLFPSNVYTFRNETTTVSAKGPNITSTNITGLNFRSNLLSSTMQPRNFDRQRFTESNYDQRSTYYRRATSPMSMYSGSDMKSRNFHNSVYPGGMSSQRSMYSGRGGSPVSMRSIDSNASVSAVDIALAFKNVNFNKYDLRIIKDAYNKLMKRKVRKKIEKRRNLRHFLKGYRRKSGYDSGELGSDSSISSSDDCRSTKSVMGRDDLLSCGSTHTDITNLRQTIKQSNMYNDCTENLKNNAFKNMLTSHSSSTRENINSKYNMSADIQYVPSSTKSVPNIIQSLPSATKNVNSVQEKPTPFCKVPSRNHNASTYNQRDKSKNSFLLPSERFNKSLASVPIPEKDCAVIANRYETSNNDGKRNLDMEDNICPDSKRKKLSNQKQLKLANKQSYNKATNILKENNNKDNKKADDFEFIKPQFPIRKSAPGKSKEILISKSNVPLTEVKINPITIVKHVEPKEHVDSSRNDDTNVKDTKNVNDEKQSNRPFDIINHSTDLSMRPSFIKRKLFTQKMDVIENKNISTDALNMNSPLIDVYSTIQREKHKTRKLVTNQSCLNRDINQEDNNLLDLIHKIVPPDRINVTNVSNKTSLSNKNSQNDKHSDDKWDVTSIISTCNNDDVSDTYTDDDIFCDNNKKTRKTKRKDKPVKNLNSVIECRVLEGKIPRVNLTKDKSIESKLSMYNCAKVFWDTDFESDLENTVLKSSELEENPLKGKVNNLNNDGKLQDKRNISESYNLHKQESVKHLTTINVKESTLKKNNINKNQTIKAFGTPNNMKTDNNEKTTNKKHSVPLTSKNIKDCSKNKKTETLKNLKNAESKSHDEQICAKSQNNNTIVMNKTNNNRTSKSKSTDTFNNTNVNNSTLQRSRRTPKIKVCCTGPTKNKEKIKTVESISKIDQYITKGNNSTTKHTKKSNDIIAENKIKTKPINKKKKSAHIVDQNIIDSEPMNRTLRSRNINLSSSFNTSNENITNITVRSLRSRRKKFNLSSSIDDSTVEGNHTAMRYQQQKTLRQTTVKNKAKGV